MAGWSVLFLPGAEDDLQELARRDRALPVRIRAEILEGFHDPFKAQRFLDVVEGHGHTGQIDRLDGSGFPKSFRLQLLQDYRATLCCLPSLGIVLLVHVFPKSSDPTYRRALIEHDARLEAYFLPFKEFVDRADQRWHRRSARGR